MTDDKQAGPRGIREAVIQEKTGKSSLEWHAILDQWGMAEKGHTAAARYLEEEHGVSGWWAQTLTVRYEWATGLRKDLAVPDDLIKAFDSNAGAKTRFEMLPPSHQREYIEWIEEAKRAETRAQRIEETITRLSDR
jgi:hypothetical protein